MAEYVPKFLRFGDKPEGEFALIGKPALIRTYPMPIKVEGRETLSPDYIAFHLALRKFPNADAVWVGRALMDGGIKSNVSYYPVAAFVEDAFMFSRKDEINIKHGRKTAARWKIVEHGWKSGRMRGLDMKPPFIETSDSSYNAGDDIENLLRKNAYGKAKTRGGIVVLGEGSEVRYALDERAYKEDGEIDFRARQLYPAIAFGNPEISRPVFSPELRRPFLDVGKFLGEKKSERKKFHVDEQLDREVAEVLRKVKEGGGDKK